MYAGKSGKERYIPVHLIANQIDPAVCGWSRCLQGCDTTCSINRIGKQTAYSKVVTNIGMLSQLLTFHKDNLDDSVDVARSYALLLYGKKGEKAVLQ